MNVAVAQDQISVRASDHESYSRLVFDWKKRVQYDVRKSDDTLTISFSAPADIDLSQVQVTPLRNVQSINVSKVNGTDVVISIPQEGRVRDFLVGNRIVVDIYNPPGPVAASQPPEVSKTEKTDLEKPEDSKTAKDDESQPDSPAAPETTKADAQDRGLSNQTPLEKAREALREILKDDVEVDLVGENKNKREGEGAEEDVQDLKPDLTTEKSKSQLQKMRDDIDSVGLNLITISSTSPTALAVFRKGGEIWMVNDQPDLVVSPQISGPNIEYFSPIRRQEIADGKVFRTYDLDNAFVRVQGGGLVWRIIVSGKDHNERALKPIRKGLAEGISRGGTIIWPFEDANMILDVPDEDSGRTIKVVVVNGAQEFSGPGMDFVDFEVLPSAAGMAIIPKVDDLKVMKTSEGIEISRPAGLALSDEDLIATAMLVQNAEKDAPDNGQRIYNFQNWLLGDVAELRDNQNVILANLPGLTLSAQVEGVITLAKMYLAHGFWAEALGFLQFAQEDLPELLQNPEFVAIKGAAQAMGFNSELAFGTLSSPKLDGFEEVGYWKAYALSDLGDWQQAYDVLPKSVGVLKTYPQSIASRVGLGVAEVALRAGDVDLADKTIEILKEQEEDLFFEQKAALKYLEGEALRQKGETEETIKIWEELTQGKDDFYRAKAGLALTHLKRDKKLSSVAETIDSLERLRYAWRGDELEAQINHRLGRTYFDAGAYVKGLNIMREAASLAAGIDLGKRVTSEMTEIFTNLLMDPDPEKLPPIEAAALYEQFAELVPTGELGDKVVQKLAEHLVSGEVLGRAAQLLQRQVDHRLEGLEAYDAAIRLTAIYLLDNQVTPAAKALNKAHSVYKTLPTELQTPARELEQNLLKARTMAGLGRPDQAIELLRELPGSKMANRLWAGIAWEAGYWDDAAEALHDVVADQNISLTRPLDEENSNLILQQAVALNLASDRIGLANLREKYTEAMQQTDKAQLFEVVTRARQSAGLADRDTLMSIVSEVDLFGDFLNSYKATTSPTN